VSRRGRRQRRPQGFSSAPIKTPPQTKAQLEDFDGCRALALRIVRAILTRDHPEEHARVVSAIFTVTDRPPETVTTVIGYLAQVVAEHFQFGCGGKNAAIDQIERQLSAVLSDVAHKPDGASQ
jgi:hypothetical protein